MSIGKDYYAALNLLGCLYDKKRQYDLALECYLKSSKECDTALFNYAALLIQRNKYQITTTKSKENDEKFEEIKKIMEKYIEKHPDDFDGYYELGELYSWKDQDIKYKYWQKAFDLGMYKVLPHLFYYYKQQIINNNPNYNINDLKDLLRSMVEKTYKKTIEVYDVNNRDKEEYEKDKTQLNAPLINKLGVEFSTTGNYVSRDYYKSVNLWKISIEISDDNNEGHYNLGISYLLGEGCEKDLNKAFFHFMKSSEDPDSQREIGAFYENGFIEQTPKKLEIAKEWYIKAANHKYNPDYESCIKITKLTDNVKEKSKYYLKAINSIRYSQSKEREYEKLKIPKDVLLYWHDKINTKIPSLKQKIIELKCRPPVEGGKLYQQAYNNFKHNI